MSSEPRAKTETSAGGVVYRMVSDTIGPPRPVFLLIRDSYRNWGFPKGHLEPGERPEAAALREVAEETGLSDIDLRGAIDTIEWHFRFRGHLIHKVCHFFLMESARADTSPQRTEGITACRWAPLPEALATISYDNARQVLRRASEMVGVLSSTSP